MKLKGFLTIVSGATMLLTSAAFASAPSKIVPSADAKDFTCGAGETKAEGGGYTACCPTGKTLDKSADGKGAVCK